MNTTGRSPVIRKVPVQTDKSPLKGRFITLEGVDGAGKSTHLGWIEAFLRGQGKDVIRTREPGGTPLGESLRALLLGQPMHIDTETLLMFASRREHLDKVILPALNASKWVLSDRFTDATFAYQGGGRQMPLRRIASLETWVQGDFQPDLTLVFDLPVEVAEARRGGRAEGVATDRFEGEDLAFFQRVRMEYVRRAGEFPSRIKILDASQSIDQIKKSLENILISICNK